MIYKPMASPVCLVALASLLAHSALAQNPPLISDFASVSPRSNFVELSPDDPVSLECKAKGDPQPEINWFKDDSPVVDIPGVEVSGSTLTFSSPDPSTQTGFYHCLASNPVGVAKSRVVHAAERAEKHPEWMIAPTLTTEPTVEIQPYGSEMTFSCAATGSPEPEIIWTKNGQVLPEFSNMEFLRIDRVDEDKVGTYACNASNEAGYAYKMVFLNIVTVKPTIYEKPRNRQGLLGQEVFLRCHANGYPLPTIRWTFKGQEVDLSPTSNYQLVNGDLLIKRVANESAGEYICIAENDQGEERTVGNLKVVSSTSIEEGPTDLTARVRETVTLKCTVVYNSNVQLSIIWKKDNADIDVQSEERISVGENNELIIQDLQFDDAGIYTCVASTSQGMSTESGTLQVEGIPPTLTAAPTGQVRPEGVNIVLLCTAEGVPEPEHVWFRDTVRITSLNNPRVYMDSEGSLHIDNAQLDDSEKYVCRAENGYGKPAIASAFIDVKIATKLISPVDDSVEFLPGASYQLQCPVEIDPSLQASSKIKWLKDDEEVDFAQDQYTLMPNYTLLLENVTESEIGNYECNVWTPVDEIVVRTSVYRKSEEDLWWLIILIIILCLIILVICICCICMVRKRAKRKGRYGVKDIEDGKKHNKSDIHYGIEDEDEVDNDLYDDSDQMEDEYEVDQSGEKTRMKKNKSKPKKKKNIYNGSGDKKPHLDMLQKTGSSSSLMTDDDLLLGRGMDEDGSFREGKYADNE